MTDDELHRIGKKAGEKAPAGFEDWEIFKRSLGFYKWAKKNSLSENQKKMFGESFKENSG